MSAHTDAKQQVAARDLDGRVAIVTGGAHGIGRGIVEARADHGADVVIADLDVDAGQKLAEAIGWEWHTR